MITYNVRYTLEGKTKVIRLNDTITLDTQSCDETVRKELQWRWAAVRGTPDVKVYDLIVHSVKETD